MERFKGILPTKSKKDSQREFDRLDSNGDNSACKDEIGAFVASNAELWSMLSVNLGMSEERCQEIATRVGMELATGLEGDEAMNSMVNRRQFHMFRKKYIVDPHGQQEFFHRSVFATFDKDNNSYLDEEELDHFLETFYKSGSIFHGDIRLPAKEELKSIILARVNDDGKLSFEIMRGVISGAAMHEFVKKK